MASSESYLARATGSCSVASDKLLERRRQDLDWRRLGYRAMFALPGVLLVCGLIRIQVPVSLNQVSGVQASANLSVADMCMLLGLLVAAVTDLSSHKVYNWTTYPLIVWAMILATIASVGAVARWDSTWLSVCMLSDSCLGLVCCGAVSFVAYRFSGGGAGDVKLAMMVGGLVGVERGLMLVGAAYILAAAGTMVISVADASALNLGKAMLRRVASFLTVYILPPNAEQQRLLRKKTPLAGYFVIAGFLSLQW